MPRNRWTRDSAKELRDMINGVVLRDGGGDIIVGDEYYSKAYIAIIHDSGGFNPSAGICAAQDPDTAIQEAFGYLEDWYLEDIEYVKEVQEEWGDQWSEILTEGFDGLVFELDPEEAAQVIESSDAKKYIEIDYREPEEDYD